MFVVNTEIVIHAPVEAVWDVLLDFERYHEWSTMLHYEGGTPQMGEKLQLRLTPPEGTGYSFSPIITQYDEPHHFAWIGVTGIAGIFDGEHFFHLEAIADDRTQLINREEYRGLLSPIIRRLGVLDAAEPGFQQMNEEIKARVESQQEQV